jgi:hypothetical protein
MENYGDLTDTAIPYFSTKVFLDSFLNPGEQLGTMKQFGLEVMESGWDEDNKENLSKDHVFEMMVLKLAGEAGSLSDVKQEDMDKLLAKQNNYIKTGAFNHLILRDENGNRILGDPYELLKTQKGREIVQRALLESYNNENKSRHRYDYDKTAEDMFKEAKKLKKGNYFDFLEKTTLNPTGKYITKEQRNDLRHKFEQGEQQFRINIGRSKDTQMHMAMINQITGKSIQDLNQEINEMTNNSGDYLERNKASKEITKNLTDEYLKELSDTTGETEEFLSEMISNSMQDPNDEYEKLFLASQLLKTFKESPENLENFKTQVENYKYAQSDEYKEYVALQEQRAAEELYMQQYYQAMPYQAMPYQTSPIQQINNYAGIDLETLVAALQRVNTEVATGSNVVINNFINNAVDNSKQVNNSGGGGGSSIPIILPVNATSVPSSGR